MSFSFHSIKRGWKCEPQPTQDFSNVSLTLGQMEEIGRKYVHVIDYDFASREVTVTLLWNWTAAGTKGKLIGIIIIVVSLAWGQIGDW